jgi:hypothetical protein
MKPEDIYIRNTTQTDIDKTYIENISESVKIFAGYFHRELNISFKEMLRKQHKRIVNGSYAGFTNPVNKIPESLFRHEIDVKLNTPILKKEWYVEELKALNLSINDSIRIKISGLPPIMWHSIENTNNGLKLYLPDNKYVDYYLDKMEFVMNRLMDGNLSLNLLGHYLQLGVICHPFEKVNFSLIMSQVNYILKFWGYTPISHGYLDFECFLNSTDEIIKKFKERVYFA